MAQLFKFIAMSKIPLFLGGVMIGLVILYTIKPPSAIPVKDGDLIFHNSTSAQSPFLEQLTDSKYTHMGIVFFEAGKPLVYEAVEPVRYVPLEQWIDRGTNDHFVVKRLKNSKEVLSEKNLKLMKKKGLEFKGKSYDRRFQWDDANIYCSELVWKIYDAIGIQIGALKQFNEFDLNSNEVKNQIKKRYTDDGLTFDPNEKVITPVDMFNSSQLKEIQRGGKEPK